MFCMSSHGTLHLCSFQLIEQTGVHGGNNYVHGQRVITPKVCKSELWVMCSALPQIVLYICVKFCENIMIGI